MKIKLDGEWYNIPCQQEIVRKIAEQHSFEIKED